MSETTDREPETVGRVLEKALEGEEPATRPDPPYARSPRFWMVWSPQAGPPRHRYTSFEAARRDASMLHRKHPDQDFYVLASCWGRKARPADPFAMQEGGEPENPDDAEPVAGVD